MSLEQRTVTNNLYHHKVDMNERINFRVSGIDISIFISIMVKKTIIINNRLRNKTNNTQNVKLNCKDNKYIISKPFPLTHTESINTNKNSKRAKRKIAFLLSVDNSLCANTQT